MSDDLATLPEDHPLRNKPLIEIGAYYRYRGGIAPGIWKEVKPAYGIANKCFNDLGPAWTAHDQWKATKP